MDLVEARKLVENRHPWERARAGFFHRLILGHLDPSRPARVLDVGCGDGWFSRRLLPLLPASSTLVGWDTALDEELLGIFSADLPPGMTLTRTEPAGAFDLILCMDVLEHVPDDRALLVELNERFLASGGLFLMSVPAWDALFSAHDLALRHYRRYTPRQGLRLMRGGGLSVLRKGGLFHGLALIRAAQVARRGRARPLEDPASYPNAEDAVGLGAWNAPQPITKLIAALLATEGRLSGAASRAGLELPGLSWWALGRKP